MGSRAHFGLILAATAALVACGGGGSTPAPVSSAAPPSFVASIAIVAPTTTGEPGWHLPLEAKLTSVVGGGIPGAPVAWSTSDPSIAAFDDGASVTPKTVRLKAIGKVTITAASGGKSASIDLEVVPSVPARRLEGVSAGKDHTCAPARVGPPLCWGANDRGQLGDGTTVDRATPGDVAVVGSVAMLSTGALHACSYGRWGGMHCWGDNSFGQFGNGTMNSAPVVSPIEGVLGEQTSSGARHACSNDGWGGVQCWGDNTTGQLGDGTTTTRAKPDYVANGHTSGLFDEWAVGHSHTCGSLFVGTSAVHACWGDNRWGQLGDGSTTNRLGPVVVAGALKLQSIAAGDRHTCGVTLSGVGYCWGDNGAGQLGTGTPASSSVPTLVAGGITFQRIVAGGSHSCGLTPAGAAYCWGSNSAGQLGDGTTQGRASPVEVLNGLSFAKITVGDRHTCGLTTSGLVYCWGSNARGQLGDGTTTDRSAPVRVLRQQ